MKPRIGIDARKARDFGIGTYTRELVAGIARSECSAEFDFVLFVRPGDEELFGGLPERFEILPEESPPYSLGELARFPGRIRRARVSLFHALHYVLPFGIAARTVVTIHDLIHLRFPFDGDTPLRYPAARYLVGHALSAADAVIVPTDAGRREVAALAPRRAAKLRIIPHGGGARFAPDAGRDAGSVVQKYTISGPYALFLGGKRRHKNVERTVEAFRRASVPDLSLVLAGPVPAGAADENGGPIRVIGVVPESDLPALYRGAAFFLYPTLAEGFGFPVLEAMAAGTPVIAADIPVVAEVAGEGALLVDPADAGAIAAAIRRVAGDPELQRDLSARGFVRAAGFSWDETADRTLAVYREVLG